MNILALIKQAPDTGLSLQVKEGGVDESNLKWVLSPYDEFALEEALKMKGLLGGKLFVMSLGPERAKEALMTGLALGADEAFHLLAEKSPQDPLAAAKALHKEASKIPDLSLIFCGKLSSDSNNFAVPQMLAALMDIPFASNINKLSYHEGLFTFHRELGGGEEEASSAKAPIVFSADKGLNRPRYPSLPGIMKAKKKPFHTLPASLEEGGIRLSRLEPPPEKKPPVMIEGEPAEQAAKLAEILKEKERLL